MAFSNTTYQIVLVSAVSVTCILSIIGSVAIIISFLAFKELRNIIRFLLFNLSLADLIVAVTNLIGALYSLKFLDETRDKEDPVCVGQAAAGLVGVDASILWTVVFIMYIYMLLTCYRPNRKQTNRIILGFITIFTWALPTVIVIVFVSLEYFGFDKHYSPAFCTVDTVNRTELYRAIIGYEMFVYFSFVVLPISTVAFFIHLCFIKKRTLPVGVNVDKYMRILRSTELKLVLIPIFFLIIRVWSLILDILTFYFAESIGVDSKFRQTLVILAGVGDSAQGFVNGVLFIILTETVRTKIANSCIKCLCCCCWKSKRRSIFSEEATNSVSPFTYRRSGTTVTTRTTRTTWSNNTEEMLDTLSIDGEDYLIKPRSTSMSTFSADIPYGSYDVLFNDKEGDHGSTRPDRFTQHDDPLRSTL